MFVKLSAKKQMLSPNELTQPIFLVGCERSGTTLLRLMLDHHPDIAFNLESEYMVLKISDDGKFPELTAYQVWLAQDRVFQHSQFAINPNLDYPGLMSDFLQQKRTRKGKRYVGATIHHAFSRLRFLWPHAKFIYLYRDGRDVAASIVNMGWAGNSYVAADLWLEAEAEWSSLRKHLSDQQCLEVRYEDLIRQTEHELSKICTFVGTQFHPQMLEYPAHTTYSLPDERLNFQWKRRMPKKEVQLLESKIGSKLLEREYPLSGHPVVSVSPLGRLVLLMDSNLRRFGWRIRRYGVMLVVLRAFALRMGSKTLVNRYDRMFDQIDDEHLK